MNASKRSTARIEVARAVRHIASAAQIMQEVAALDGETVFPGEARLAAKHGSTLVRIGLDLSHPDFIHPTLF